MVTGPLLTFLVVTLGSSEAGCAWPREVDDASWCAGDVEPDDTAAPTRPWSPTHAHAHSIVDTWCMKHRQHLFPPWRTAWAGPRVKPHLDQGCHRWASHYSGPSRSKYRTKAVSNCSPGGRSAVSQVVWRGIQIMRISHHQQYEFSTSIKGNL